MSTFACAGLSCHNRVEQAGQFCYQCWPSESYCETRRSPIVWKRDPIQPNPEGQSIPHLRLNMLEQVWKLNFGTAQEKRDALEQIAVLTTALQHETKKEKTEC